MLGKKVGIDLGTTTTRIIVKGEGMIASEPTAVAFRDGGMQTAVFGEAAFSTVAEDAEFQLRRPIAGGEIVDASSARWLVNHAMIRAAGRQRIFKPDVVIAVMSSLPGGQRRSLLEAAALAGARTAYLLDAPLAAAMGAGIRLNGPNGHLVVDVGAGKTDVAALALEGTVSGRCLTGHGGMRLHDCVADHIRTAHGVTLDAATIEEVIASLARVGPHEERTLEVTGSGAQGGQHLTITSTELNCVPRRPRAADPRGARRRPRRYAGRGSRTTSSARASSCAAAGRASRGSTAPSPPRPASRCTATASPSCAPSGGPATPWTTSMCSSAP